MESIRIWLCRALVLAVFFAAGRPAFVDGQAEPGFTSLFNGKDLTGWRYPGQKGEPQDGKAKTADGRVEVKDGAIVMNERDAQGKGGIKDLYTQRSFERDFVLKVQFRAGPKADSGVYLRGPQLQIRDFARRGEQKQLKGFKNDDWNDLEITVRGTEATFTLNGERLQPDKMKVPAQGPVGLQAESGKFEFRNVQVKELP
jgi:hypothetical protein